MICVGVGRLAQLVEHLIYTEGVAGSSPAPSTRYRYLRIKAKPAFKRSGVCEALQVASLHCAGGGGCTRNALPALFLVHHDCFDRGEAHQNVDNLFDCRPRAEETFDEVIVERADKTPVKTADHEENKRNDM